MILIIRIGSQLDHSIGKLTFILTIFKFEMKVIDRALENQDGLQQFSPSLQALGINKK